MSAELLFFPLHRIIRDANDAPRCGCGQPDCEQIGKHPAVRGWAIPPGQPGSYWTEEVGSGETLATPDERGVLVQHGRGIPCGKVNDFFVVDLDVRAEEPPSCDPDARYPQGRPARDGYCALGALEDLYGELPGTLAVRTPTGGCHLYYGYPAGLSIKTSASALGPGVDIRGDGGFVCAPGSPHRVGGPYEAIDEAAAVAMAPDWLLALVSTPSATAKTPEENPGPAYPDREGPELDAAIEKARRYLADVPACCEDGESSARLTRYAAYLRAQRIPAPLSLELLEEFNLRCTPPWDPEDLQRVLRSVERGPVVEDAWRNALVDDRLAKNLANRAARLPPTPKDAAADEKPALAPSAADPLRGLPHLARVAVVGRDAIVELSERPVVWLWEGIASEGLTVLLAAAPSSGKTTLLFLLIAARANLGEPIDVLGHVVEPAPEGKYIVVIEAEHSDESAARILRRAMQQQGIDEAALDRVILVARGSVVLGDEAWQDVEKLIAAGLVSDVVLDTLARVAPLGDDANDEASQVAVFRAIAQCCELAPRVVDTDGTIRSCRPTFWVASHLRKFQGSVPTLADVSGSGQRVGQSDVVLLMGAQRDAGMVVKSVICQFGKVREKNAEDWPRPVEYTVGRDGIKVCSAEPADTRPLKEQIATRLELGVPLTKFKLREKLDRKTEEIDDALSELFRENRIFQVNDVVRGRTRVAYQLRQDGTQEARERGDRLVRGLGRLRGEMQGAMGAGGVTNGVQNGVAHGTNGVTNGADGADGTSATLANEPASSTSTSEGPVPPPPGPLGPT